MAHFAKLDESNVVTQIVVTDNEHPNGDEGYQELVDIFGGTWIKTSFNTRGGQHYLGGTPFRKNYAIIGGTYDYSKDAFIPPKPFPSWNLNEETCLWEAPIPAPEDGKMYFWDEESQTWNIHPLDQ